MKERVCVCGKPLRETHTICPSCVYRLRRQLADQPGHLHQLEIELARMTKKVAANDGGRTSATTQWIQAGDRYLESISTENLKEWDRRAVAAADAMHEQRRTLALWARKVKATHPPISGPYCRERCPHPSCRAVRISRWPAGTIAALAGYLEHHLRFVRSNDAGPEMVAQFRSLTSRILKVIDTPQNRTRIYAGPCPEQYTDAYNVLQPCPGKVEAIVPADEAIPPKMRCRACGVEWRSDQWVKAGHRIQRREAQMRKQRELAQSMVRRAS